MPEKRGNIAIRSCFLTGSWEGPIISCYAKHLFYSLRTCDVSELVSPFPLRHVPWCHEKGICACWPSRKDPLEIKQHFCDYVAGEKWQLHYRVEVKIGPSFKVSDVFMTFEKKIIAWPNYVWTTRLSLTLIRVWEEHWFWHQKMWLNFRFPC